MAKKSKIARNNQRAVIVERYAAKRLELKKALVDPAGTDETREAARAVCSRNTASRVSASVTWPTAESCRASRSPAGSHPASVTRGVGEIRRLFSAFGEEICEFSRDRAHRRHFAGNAGVYC